MRTQAGAPLGSLKRKSRAFVHPLSDRSLFLLVESRQSSKCQVVSARVWVSARVLGGECTSPDGVWMDKSKGVASCRPPDSLAPPTRVAWRIRRISYSESNSTLVSDRAHCAVVVWCRTPLDQPGRDVTTRVVPQTTHNFHQPETCGLIERSGPSVLSGRRRPCRASYLSNETTLIADNRRCDTDAGGVAAGLFSRGWHEAR